MMDPGPKNEWLSIDALRAWGDSQVVRNNYIHDINGTKSAGSPHVDCYQAYQAGSGPPASNYKARTPVLVRPTSGSRYTDGPPANNTPNRILVDPATQPPHDVFIKPPSSPPVKPTDFNKFYRDSVGRVVAPPPPP